MNFLELPSTRINDGVQHKVFFPNGYGASIVKHSFSYGGRKGLWELAVIKGTAESWDICYDTDITSDVLGYLSEEEVNSTLENIAAL